MASKKQNNKENKKAFFRIIEILKPYTKLVFTISILAIIVDIIEVIKPYLLKIAMDDLLPYGLMDNGKYSILGLSILYLVLVLVGNLIEIFNQIKTSIMGENILFDTRNKLFNYFQKANCAFHDVTPAGKIYSRIISDVDDISEMFKDVIATIFKDFMSILVILVMMFYLSYKLSFICIMVIPFIMLLCIIFIKKLDKYYDIGKRLRADINAFLAESIYGSKLIKIFNIQKEKQEELEKKGTKFMMSRIPVGAYQGMFPGSMQFLQNFAISLIFYVAAKNSFGITLDVGVVYVFVTYIKNLFEPIHRIVENIEVIQDAMVSINKIYDLLEKEENLEDFENGKSLPTLKGKLEFRNVWFAYKEEKWILKNISFVINPRRNNCSSW